MQELLKHMLLFKEGVQWRIDYQQSKTELAERVRISAGDHLTSVDSVNSFLAKSSATAKLPLFTLHTRPTSDSLEVEVGIET